MYNSFFYLRTKRTRERNQNYLGSYLAFGSFAFAFGLQNTFFPDKILRLGAPPKTTSTGDDDDNLNFK